jgi:hypothetical protein
MEQSTFPSGPSSVILCWYRRMHYGPLRSTSWSTRTRTYEHLCSCLPLPDRLSPDLLSPDLLSPDRLSPDLLSPDLLSPDLLSPVDRPCSSAGGSRSSGRHSRCCSSSWKIGCGGRTRGLPCQDATADHARLVVIGCGGRSPTKQRSGADHRRAGRPHRRLGGGRRAPPATGGFLAAGNGAEDRF